MQCSIESLGPSLFVWKFLRVSGLQSWRGEWWSCGRWVSAQPQLGTGTVLLLSRVIHKKNVKQGHETTTAVMIYLQIVNLCCLLSGICLNFGRDFCMSADLFDVLWYDGMTSSFNKNTSFFLMKTKNIDISPVSSFVLVLVNRPSFECFFWVGTPGTEVQAKLFWFGLVIPEFIPAYKVGPRIQ